MPETISVIIPVYKVEQYLDACISSVINQSYPYLEIILVDDGSPDECPIMCDNWAKKDARIRVIHKENGGLADARNAGLKIASGDYIGFVDSDDFIASSLYEKLMEQLRLYDSDIAACGVKMIWEDGKTRMLTQSGNKVLNNAEAMEAIIKEDWLKQPVWGKIYKRGIVDGIIFEKGKCHEDVFWSYQVVARTKRVCVIDEPMYFYTQRSDSIMGEAFSEKRLDALEAKEQRLVFLKQNYPSLADLAQNDLFFYSMYLMQHALNSSETIEPVKERILWYARKYPAIPKTMKEFVWVCLAKISFKGTCKLRNWRGIGL